MASALYTHAILRHAAALKHNDHLPNPGATAEARSAVCGSRITAEIQLDQDHVITAIALRATACALGQASAAILRSHAAGLNENTVRGVRDDIAAFLGHENHHELRWPELHDFGTARNFPARHAAILLPYDAVLAAFAVMP
jgi:NifU-like protein involved in Fe-S cluster formation